MAERGSRIDVDGLTKRFGAATAVDDLTFSVEPGRVTGFLGPNGAGKTTTLRCLLGLVEPTEGSVRIGGQRYRDLTDPLSRVGAALEAADFHPGRSARDHLRVIALAAEVDRSRVEELLGLVGLADVAGRRVGGFSLGMRQRLALAQALLGDPGVLLLDEPANGLDPAGIVWLRGLLRTLAADGRTVLVSSHVLGEVQQSVDEVVVISHGRLVHQGSLAELSTGPTTVRVRTPSPEALCDALEEATPEPLADGALRFTGVSARDVGRAAFEAGVELHELTEESSDLESRFLDLTTDGAPR